MREFTGYFIRRLQGKMTKYSPNLYIIGTYKAGTTSLHNYLVQHPEIAEGVVKESHILDGHVYIDNPTKSGMEGYYGFFQNSIKSKYKLDSSPSYFYGGEDLIRTIKDIEPNAKFILLLRDPFERLYSYYNHCKSQDLLNDSWSIFLEKCLKEYSPYPTLKHGLYNNAILEGEYNKFITPWIESCGEDLFICHTEELLDNSQKVLKSIYSFLGIVDITDVQALSIENKTISPKFPYIHRYIIEKKRLQFIRYILPNSIYDKFRVIYREYFARKISNRSVTNSDKIIYNIYKHSFDNIEFSE